MQWFNFLPVLQQLELSEKMDSNFSITINTVTFVKMSFIFLGIIPFVRAIVYSQTTPSCCVMSLFLSHVSRSIQFRNVLLSLIFAISSFLVKRTTPFDKIDLVYQFYWNSLYMLLIYMIDLKKKKKTICFSCKLYGQITPIFLIYLKRVIFR